MTCRANLENEKISILFFSISDVYFQYCIAPSTIIVKTHIKVYNKKKVKIPARRGWDSNPRVQSTLD